MTEQELPPALRHEVNAAHAARERAEQETSELIQHRDTVLVPLWDRIAMRRLQDPFGVDIDRAMTRRRAG